MISSEIRDAGETLNKETMKLMDRCLYDLTTTGSNSLDETVMKKFKRFCRESDDYVRYAFLLIMRQLNKKHSEIRLSAFQVADELFNRSHAFRETLVNHLQAFLALTTETESERPLPPPKSAAKKLKTDALHALQLWQDKYGQGYKKLGVGYNYLKNCKHVDFNDIRAQNQAERQRIENEEKRKKKIMTDKLAKVLKDISEIKPEIENCAREAESCLQLLLPTPDEFILSLGDESTGGAPEQSTSGARKQRTVIAGIKDPPKENICNHGELHLSKNGCIVDSKDSSSENHQSQKSTSDGRLGVNDSEISNEIHHINNDSQARLLPHGSSVCVHSSEAKLTIASKPNVPEKEIEGSTQHESSDGSDVEDDADYDTEDMDACEGNLHAHGVFNPSFSIVLELPAPGPVSVEVTTDNSDVVRSLTDASKLITNNYLPKVIRWLEILGKNGAQSEDIKAAIDLKRSLENIKMKCMELKLVTLEPEKQVDISDDEDDFEEVPEKEGYEPHIPNHLRAEYGLDTPLAKPGQSSQSSMKEKDSSVLAAGKVGLDNSKLVSMSKEWSIKDRISTDDVSDPTSLAAALANVKRKSTETPAARSTAGSSAERKNSAGGGQALTTAPVVSFGTDLAYWENPDQIEAPVVVKMDSLHRFWTPKETESEKPSQHDIAAVKNRVFYFTGQFEPVKWKCRAILPSGKLCERMDRVKCPFHGKIIPRDKTGNPNGEIHPSSTVFEDRLPSSSLTDDIKSEVHEGNDAELPPWQDPELQREIELATGHDLGSARSQKLLDKKTKAKGKGKGKKKSNLTNIEAVKNNSRKRLENRIFNKGSIKRVCSTLDNADYKRVRDKFANQFNYSLG